MLRGRLIIRRIAGPLLYATFTLILLLRTAPGRVGIDTKQYLFLDPSRLLSDASSMWQPGVAFGTVPHQNIGFLWPMGPFFWVGEQLGIADWVTQRLWLAALYIAAGLGVRWLAREFGVGPAGAWVAGVVYAWSPYSLGYVHRTSVLLLPWAGLGFLTVLAGRAVRRGGWRDPAAFALVAATVGGANATALLLAGLAPLLWLVHLAMDPDIGVRRAVRAAFRIGSLTTLVSLWWFVALVVQGRFSLNILRYTETLDAVARSTSATEVLRGLGYWLFYGRDRLDPWIEPAPAYQTSLVLLAASFALPLLGVTAILAIRSRYRGYCATLLVVGVAISVGAFPWESPSPLGAASKALAVSTDLGLALRSSTRAVPLISLALALAAGGAVSAAVRWVRPVGLAAAATACALALGAFPPLWQGTLVSEALSRDEQIPAAWEDAIAHVDAEGHDTRILEVPGIDLTFHRWGATWEPITPGLTDRPFAARELVPYGGPGAVDLLRALDRRMQEGTIEPEAVAPIARLLGAGDLLVRSDLEYERFRTPRPRILWDVIRRADLGAVTAFGEPVPNTAGPELPLIDEIELGTPDEFEDPPPVAVVEVPDTRPLLHASPLDGALLVSGSGEGLVDAAAAGLIDRPGLVVYSASLANDPDLRERLVEGGADLLVTDSNRRRAERWRTLRDTVGATEAAGERAVDDQSDARLELFPDVGDDARTVTVTTGARATATAYGNPITYTPSERPQLAVDGSESTAWRVGAFADPRGERLVIDLERPLDIDEFEVLLASSPGRRITRLGLRVDGVEHEPISFSDPTRATVALAGAGEVSRLEFEILDTDPRATSASPDAPAVGIAEVRIPGLSTNEAARLPVDLVRTVEDDLAHRLVYVLSRLRSDPAEVVRADDEGALRRIVEVPSMRDFAVTGSATLAADANDSTLWGLVGASGPGVVASDSLGGDLSSRPWAALDGDASTSWQTGFGPQVGRWIEIDLGARRTVDHLDIELLDDGRHSRPTALTISAGGTSHRVDVPPGDGLRRLDFPPVEGDTLRVTVAEVEATVTRDWYRLADIEMPIGVREIEVDGLAPTVLRGSIDDACRSGLLTVDGSPVDARVRGTIEAALAGRPLSLEACDGGRTLEGEVSVSALDGEATGVDVDRLVLASAPGGGADTVGGPMGQRADVTPRVDVLEADDTHRRLRVDTGGEDVMIVLGENRNDGWTAHVGDDDLGHPILVDGYANGWVLPASGRPLEVTLRWEPQRSVDLAIAASAAGALLCLAVLIRGRRRPPITRHRPSETLAHCWAPVDGQAGGWRITALLAVGAAAMGWLAVGPVVGVGVGVVTFVASLRRWGPVAISALAVGMLASAFASVIVGQRRGRWRADFDWPTHFLTAHRLAMTAVLLVAVGVVLQQRRDGSERGG